MHVAYKEERIHQFSEARASSQDKTSSIISEYPKIVELVECDSSRILIVH